jgi:hypothetical protein
MIALLVWAAPAPGRAGGIGWPEAVSRLAEQRSNAVFCVASLKRHGNDDQISRGQLIYGPAKANFDGVIAGLVTALAEGGNPEGLPSLDAKLERSASGLAQLCKTAADLAPSASGQKGVLNEIVKAAVEPVVKALSDGVATLYTDHRKDDSLTRETIQTQLEAAKWPDFGTVDSAQ